MNGTPLRAAQRRQLARFVRVLRGFAPVLQHRDAAFERLRDLPAQQRRASACSGVIA